MLFIIGFIILLLIFIVVIACIKTPQTKGFDLKDVLSEEQLKKNMHQLASRSKNFIRSGAGIDVNLISKQIDKAYDVIAAKVASKAECFSFEEWIYDNYYKLSDKIKIIKASDKKFTKLPHINNSPRAYVLCQNIVGGCGGFVAWKNFSRLIKEYNNQTPLCYDEIVAVKDLFTLALIEYIAIFCSKCCVINNNIEKAKRDAKCQKISYENTNFDSYVTTLYDNLDSQIRNSLSQHCLNDGVSIHMRKNIFFDMVSRYNGNVSCAYKTIFDVDIMFSDKNIISLSPINVALENAEEVHYNSLTLATKYMYLYEIFALSKRKKLTEFAVLNSALFNAHNDKKDMSFYILPPPKSSRIFGLYVVVYLFLVALSSVVSLMFLSDFFIAVPIILVPISFSIIGILFANLSYSGSYRRSLPSVTLENTCVSEVSTAVVAPRLVCTKEEISDAFKNLHTVIAANRSDIFRFYLLFDFKNHCAKVDEKSDKNLHAMCESEFKKSPYKDKICCLVRERKQVKSTKDYQGWEKKRGAIIDFNDLILTNDKSNFSLVLGENKIHKYAITLDSDTQINCCRELVEIMQHPYNEQKNVMSLVIKTSPQTQNTLFSRTFAGCVGLSTYANHCSSLEHNLFASGNYTGKGIYRVCEFQQKIKGAFKDNRLLSHDYVEGAVVGCADSCCTALDEFPANFSSHLSRQTRWLRGDWQCLMFTSRHLRDQSGAKYKNPINGIGKWHIISNAINSLASIASFALLFFAMFSLRPVPILLLAFSKNIIELVFSLRVSIKCKNLNFIYELARQLFFISMLPCITIYSLFAILLTIGRMIVKRNLLEWKTFAHSNGSLNVAPNFLAASVILIAIILLNVNLLFAIFSVIFVLGIITNCYLSLSVQKISVISTQISDELKSKYSVMYQYFVHSHTKENNFLPCDNYQETNNIFWANRTSPTNIGYAIMAHIGAYEMGIIDYKKMIGYTSEIIDTIEKMEKWNGNLYNWTSTTDLNTLSPKYVSTVDSGNFLLALMALKSYADNHLRNRVQVLIDETQIEKLFDIDRGLFHIGYNADTDIFDSSYYDLVSSESSATYLIAIACGKIDKNAWYNLSRQSLLYSGEKVLCSWTGGMFEYLLAGQFFSSSKNTTFYKNMTSSINAQVKFAKNNDMDIWGVSESQYDSFDDNGNYLYKAFGVTDIALSNNPKHKIISPYSTFMALPFAPKAAIRNYKKIEKKQMVGKYGLYESYNIETKKSIKTFMAHHTGMALLGICNYVCDNAIIKKMADDAEIRAVELLLSEQMQLNPKVKRTINTDKIVETKQKIVCDKRNNIPLIGMYSCGKYALIVNQEGRGYSVYGKKAVTRYTDRDDGQRVFAVINGKKVDLLSGICTIENAKISFEKVVGNISFKTEISVLHSGNGEMRNIEIFNASSKPCEIEILSALQPALNFDGADYAHKTYSDLFFEMEIVYDALIATKTNIQDPIYCAYFVMGESKTIYNNSKSAFYNRMNEHFEVIKNPIEPICSSKTSITLQPKKTYYMSIFTVCSEKKRELLCEIEMIKTDGYLTRCQGILESMFKCSEISSATRCLGSKILYCANQSISSKKLASLAPTERPILYLRIDNMESIPRLKSKLIDFCKLYRFGIEFNLFIIYKEQHNYFLYLSEKINEMLDEVSYRVNLGFFCDVVLVNAATEEEKANLIKKNAINVDAIYIENTSLPEKKPHRIYPNAELKEPQVKVEMGYGGFLEDYSYFIDLTSVDTPRAWSNVIANGNIGTIINESGGGYTFYDNSRQKKISVWQNDSIIDRPSEFITISEKSNVWSVTKNPCKTNSNYFVKHGFGYSEFMNNYNGFIATQKVFIDKKEAVKYYDVKIKNAINIDRKLVVMFAFEPILGDFRKNTESSLNCCQVDEYTIKIENATNGLCCYVSCDNEISLFCRYKENFTDKNGNICTQFLSVGSQFFPSISCNVDVPAKSSGRVKFSVSHFPSVNFDSSDAVFRRAQLHYNNLSDVTIDGYSDVAIMSRYLPYQVYCSRFLARAGLYQAGGAIGFRDQLQDCLTMLYIDSDMVRQHILECASKQFEKGDVLHWWHSPAVGVRTKMTDDRLFLPIVVAEYITYTHDYAILSARVPWLTNTEIGQNAHDIYASMDETQHTDSILEHCLRAIKVSFDFGDNGLNKIGTGDWNDAMDEVGKNGEGTSVFVSMLLYYAIDKFLPYVRDGKTREELLQTSQKIKDAIDESWDGEWFIRAIKDNGEIIGSKKSQECKIDLLTQSWASLSGACEDDKCLLSLKSVENYLVDYENKMVKLLSPPFKETKNVGYITQYPLCVRENGGQYTHATAWYIMSLVKNNQIELAWKIFKMTLPTSHSKTKAEAKKYMVEPYVMAADVYAGDKAGRGGWSWYTGSANWYYKIIVECFLGVKYAGSKVTIEPNLPNEINIIKFKLRYKDSFFDVTIDNTSKQGGYKMRIGNIVYTNGIIDLSKNSYNKKVTLKREKNNNK